MKTITMRDLNRRTASVLNAVEQGESFELRRHGTTVGYLTRTVPQPERIPDWRAHFGWLKRQKQSRSKRLLLALMLPPIPCVAPDCDRFSLWQSTIQG